MAENILSRYSVEIFTPLGSLIADLTGLASMRQMNVARNRAGSCSFTINLLKLEALSRKLNLTPQDLLAVNRNEVKIRRGTRYLFGGQICHFEVSVDAESVDIKVLGFLDLFSFRNLPIETSYVATDAGAIAWDAINVAQSVTDGNYGITQGTIQTSVNRDRTYPIYKNVKDIIVELTEVQNGFDMEITHDKTFNVYYPYMGFDKSSDLKFYYPGNIKKLKIATDGTKMYNRAYVRGQGFGTAQPIVTVEDAIYQPYYKVRETVLDYSDIAEEANLTLHGEEKVSLFKDNIEIPQVTIDGNKEPYVGSYWLGDRISLTVLEHAMFNYLSQNTYRIDAIDISIDDDDVEDVTLSLSKF